MAGEGTGKSGQFWGRRRRLRTQVTQAVDPPLENTISKTAV